MTKPPASFNPALRFVRVVEERANGMVEFEFAVGEPDLFVEMVLPKPAFDDFCKTQGVVPTAAIRDESGERVEDWDWTLYSAREHRIQNRD
jgi:phenol hydroxylase P0 protein